MTVAKHGLRRISRSFLCLGVALGADSCQHAPILHQPSFSQPVVIEPNDNRRPAGTLRDGVLIVELDAVLAGWRPDLEVDTAVTVQAFTERGSAPQVPGPLIRAPAGAEIRVIVRNLIPGQPLLFHGPTAISASSDTVTVAPGAVGELRFRADKPGTYRYLGRTNLAPVGPTALSGRDAQLTGAIVIDPEGVEPDPDERIFVMTLIDIVPDSALGTTEDIWELAINGRSWPHTERLQYPVGDTVRWRWVNATDRIHPMHLHGFHFRVLAKGDGRTDTSYVPEATRLAVTESMMAGTTFQMEWVPTRAGNWLMHCHMVPHITPFPERPDSMRQHDVHDVMRHPEQAMAGLVLGITTVGERPDDPALARGGTRHRLFVQESKGDSTRGLRRSYVLQREAEPAPDSVAVPGSSLVVRRGQTVTVTVINRMSQPTSVHWHGMELESVFDGVPGYSGVDARRAPLIAPGDSFTVSFTPPRTGTYMYHTHMDEEDQLAAGLYAPLLVLEPGAEYSPATDLSLVLGHVLESNGEPAFALNGQLDPLPISVRVGTPYRLRLINLYRAAPVRVAFLSGDSTLTWRWLAKDGADTPSALTLAREARIPRVGVGEAYDFEWIPRPGERPVLVLDVIEGGGATAKTLRQVFQVRP